MVAVSAMRSIFTFLAFCLFPTAALYSAPVVKHPFKGITLIHDLRSTPRNIAVHTLIVDLDEPGISLRVTPSNGAAANETNLQTTLNYLTTSNAQLAVNAHFFSPVSTEGTPADVLGLSVSDGDAYSPAQSGFPAFILRTGLVPQVIQPAETVPADVQQAVAGDFQIVTAGANTGTDNTSHHAQLHPRTAIGHSQDGNQLILMTVDGRQTGHSEGVTTGELGELMLAAGAWQALNLDGGGSTTLASSAPLPHVVNVTAPDTANPGVQRANGSSLAIFALPDTRTAATAPEVIAQDSFDYPDRAWGTDANLKPNGGGVRNLWGGGGWLGPWRDAYGETRFNGIAGATNYPAGGRSAPLSYQDAAGHRLVTSGSVLRGSFGASASSFRYLDMMQVSPAFLKNGAIGADGAAVWISFLAQSNDANAGNRYSYFEFGSSLRLGKINDIPNNQFWAARASTASAAGNIATSTVSTAAVAMYLAKIEFNPGDDTVKVWLNPPLGGESLLGAPAMTITVPDFTFHTVFYRNRYSSDFDELRLGSSYAAVTPVAITPDILSIAHHPITQAPVLNWRSVPDKLYQISHSTDLTTWTPFARPTRSTSNTTTQEPSIAPGAAQGFWQLTVPPAREP